MKIHQPFSAFALFAAVSFLGTTSAVANTCDIGEGSYETPEALNAALIGSMRCLTDRLDELAFENAELRDALETKEAQYGQVPRGVVFMFDRSKGCPKGWEDLGSELRGRVAVAALKDPTDRYGYRQTGGSETHVLSIDEMPPHDHSYTDVGPEMVNGIQFGQNGNRGVNWPARPKVTSSEGRGEPHNNMPPYVAFYFCKKS